MNRAPKLIAAVRIPSVGPVLLFRTLRCTVHSITAHVVKDTMVHSVRKYVRFGVICLHGSRARGMTLHFDRVVDGVLLQMRAPTVRALLASMSVPYPIPFCSHWACRGGEFIENTNIKEPPSWCTADKAMVKFWDGRYILLTDVTSATRTSSHSLENLEAFVASHLLCSTKTSRYDWQEKFEKEMLCE